MKTFRGYVVLSLRGALATKQSQKDTNFNILSSNSGIIEVVAVVRLLRYARNDKLYFILDLLAYPFPNGYNLDYEQRI